MKNFREDFPIFKNEFEPKGIIYFDSASTTLKPQKVISRITQFYEYETSNVSRGNHVLSERNTQAIEDVRAKTASFIKAQSNEILFTSNCTDAINLVANCLDFSDKDEVIVTIMEHHSNYLPWLQKANVKIVQLDQNGLIDLKHLEELITDKTKLIAFSYASNITGNIQPVEEIIKLAKKNNILTLIDAAQIMSHSPVDMRKLDCDFLAFSAHKMLGPSGLGILYVKKERQDLLRPIKFGGGMVNKVELDEITLQDFPYSFEAGTPNIEGILGFGAAIDYIVEKGFDSMQEHLNSLENYFRNALSKLDFIDLLLIASTKHLPIFTIVIKNPKVDIKDLTQMFSDSYNIMVRGGFHCCQLLFNQLNLTGGIRASLHIYNTKEDIDKFIQVLGKLRAFF